MPDIYYKCSKCHATRKSYENAEACEGSHLAAISVRETEYTVGAYPYRVVITFPDNKEIEYVAQHLNGT